MEKIDVNFDFEELKPIYKGYESNIYYMYGLLIKIFKTNEIDILKNKRKKIEILNSLPIECKPILAVEKNGINIGYAMKEMKNFYTLDNKLLSTKKSSKINDLKKIKIELDQLHKYGIIYGDLAFKNILTNGDNFCLCDLDNCKINDYNFDMTSFNQFLYLKRINEIDEKLDDYMFNILTIGYTYNIALSYVLSYLREHNIPFRFNNKENREILNNMFYISDENKENLNLFINNVKTLKKRR